MLLNSKCAKGTNKIFRPWDVKDNAQDSTVSTTTNDCDEVKAELNEDKDENMKCKEDKYLVKKSNDSKKSEIIKDNSIYCKSLTSQNSTSVIQEYNNTPLDYPLYSDMLHTNLAQTLGIQPTDPLLIESMTHGYAFEEYARVLNEEHHAKLLSNRKQRPKKYKCPHCDVGFSNNGQLKGHIRIHTGERPFKCDEKNCGKTFTRNEELTRHKRIHSGLRPFPCTHCGKRFGRKDHLKKHTRTHLQPRGIYAVPVMLPIDHWASSPPSYTYLPMLY